MSHQIKFKKFEIFGVQIDAISISDAANYICTLAANDQSKACYITKPYVEFLDQAYSNDHIKSLLNQSELCLPDGIALNWATTYLYGGKRNTLRLLSTLTQIILAPRTLYTLLPDRFGGTNAVWPLLKQCQDRGLKVFLIGSPQNSSIRQTATAIKRKLPHIQIVGTAPGEIGGLKNIELMNALTQGNPESELINRLEQAKPDLVLVGMGFPLQEMLMARLSNQLAHGVFIGEGGTFDYRSFGGKQPKAPRFIQKIGLEWLWRLLLQPQRLPRQLAIPRFIWRVYLSARQEN